MAYFLDVLPDPFKSNGTALADFVPKKSPERSAKDPYGFSLYRGGGLGASDFSQWEANTPGRPISGIAIKPNTYAFVQIIDKDGKIVRVFNKLSKSSNPYSSGSYTGRTSEGTQVHANRNTGTWGLGDEYPDTTLSADSVSAAMSGMDAKGNPRSTVWTDWLLQSVREERSEKTQLVETFWR